MSAISSLVIILASKKRPTKEDANLCTSIPSFPYFFLEWQTCSGGLRYDGLRSRSCSHGGPRPTIPTCHTDLGHNIAIGLSIDHNSDVFYYGRMSIYQIEE